MSEHHNANLRGKSTLTDYVPTADEDIATMKQVRELSGAGSAARSLFITDAASAGNLDITWEADTIPADSVVESLVTDNPTITFSVLVEGGMRYSPTITVDVSGTIVPIPLIQHAQDVRLYVGSIEVTLTEPLTTLLFSSSTGTEQALVVDVQADGPAMLDSVASLLPTAPGHVDAKEDDTIEITGAVANSAVDIYVSDAGAAKNGNHVFNPDVDDSHSPGFKSFVLFVKASALNGPQIVTFQAVNNLGTRGAPHQTPAVTMDQTKPVITLNDIGYPSFGGALKDSETAAVEHTVTDYDSINYVFDNGTLVGPTVYEQFKVLTRTSGDYVTSPNFHITATKDSNDSSTTLDIPVIIANSAPTFDITFPAGSIFTTTPAEVVSNLTILPSQRISSLQSVVASTGNVQSAQMLSPTLGNVTLGLSDAHSKGPQTLTVTGTNLSGLQGVSVIDWSIEGTSERTLTYGVAAQMTAIGSTVLDVSKLQVKYAGTADLLTYVASKADTQDAFTIVNSDGNLDPNGTHLWLNDVAFTGANTSGTLQVTYSESP